MPVLQREAGAGDGRASVGCPAGYFDGDDHAIAASELTLTNGASCTGAFKWSQKHDSGNNA